MKLVLGTRLSYVFGVCGITALAVVAGYVGGLSGQDYADYIKQVMSQEQLIQKARGTRPLSISELISQTTPSVVSFFTIEPKKSSSLTYPLLVKNQKVGSGIVISSDGWIIAPLDIVLNAKKATKTASIENLIIVYNQKIYPITSYLDDTAAGISYIKIGESSMRPASFAWDQSASGDVNAYKVSQDGSFAVTSIGKPHYMAPSKIDGYIQNTNVLSKRLNPDVVYSSLGDPVLADNGDIIGIMGASGIIPSYIFEQTLGHALSTGKVERMGMKIRYYDNAWLPHTQFVNPSLPASGATIIDPMDAKSSEPSQGLLAGDIVLDVNNEKLDLNRSFAEILMQYNPGDDVELGIERKGSQATITLKLK